MRNKIEKLKNELIEHNYLYHSLDRPQISDTEYDRLFQQLLKLEQEYPEFVFPDSPTQRVGFEALDKFEKADHTLPMLSLQNAFSFEDIQAFDDRIKKVLGTTDSIEYICEPKLDGLAMEIVYENGVLTRAITRGDGITGELVTNNIKTISSIPLTLPKELSSPLVEIRGEVVIRKDDFLKLNAQQSKAGEAPFANPRNAAAGTIRQLDPKVVESRPLIMYAYAPGSHAEAPYATHAGFFNFLEKLKFPNLINYKVSKNDLIKTCSSADEIFQHFKFIDSVRPDLNFEIDGMVVKVNNYNLQTELGFVARSPRWATAVKFAPEQAETIINDIIIQVGRTGALTPVAVMNPTKVGGVTVTNATLHNKFEIERKDIRIGDSIIIQRAGDVIPEVDRVLLDKRPANVKPFQFPANCPACHEEAYCPEDEAVTRCLNPICPAVTKEALKHFVSKRAMNIEKLGQKNIELFWNEKIIQSFSDIYRIKMEEIENLERHGNKSANNILSSIESSKTPELSRFIFALGIRFVGEQTAKILAKFYKNLDSFLQAQEEELIQINDIGPKVASSIVRSLKNKKFVDEVLALVQLGVEIQETKESSTPKSLLGIKIVITGTFDGFERKQLKNMIEDAGGSSPSSVSKKTDYILAGASAGSKLEKGQSLGIKIINVEEFLELLQK